MKLWDYMIAALFALLILLMVVIPIVEATRSNIELDQKRYEMGRIQYQVALQIRPRKVPVKIHPKKYIKRTVKYTDENGWTWFPTKVTAVKIGEEQ